VGAGVRQGCLLSPILFALFIDDLPAALEGGVFLGHTKVKALLYADDLVLVADSPIALQRNINFLAEYLNHWNLVLNRNKSKIVVFRSGGKLSKAEAWRYNGCPIEVISNYKYLGVQFNSRLSFVPHLEAKVSVAKYSLNSQWSSFMLQGCVPLVAKYRVFNSISRVVVGYGAQVWGFEPYDVLEKFRRFFLKKLYALPMNCPNYFLDSETNLELFETYTLQLHLRYCAKALGMDDHRLPHIAATQVISKKTFWFKCWRSLAEKYLDEGFSFTGSPSEWMGKLLTIPALMRTSRRKEAINRAAMSEHFLLYRSLVTDFESTCVFPLLCELKFCEARWLLKLRGELLYLKYRPWVRSNLADEMCPLCNSNSKEDLHHFLLECSILSEVRRLHFGALPLTRESVISCLTGLTDCRPLIAFVSHAWKVRYEWVNC